MKYQISEQELERHMSLSLTQNGESLLFSYYKRFYKRGAWSSRPIIRPDFKLTIYATSGVICVTGDRIYSITPGSVLLLRPHETHFGNILKDGVQEFYEFNFPPCLFDGLRDGRSLLPEFTDESGNSVILLTTEHGPREQLFSCLSSIREEMQNDTPRSRMRCYSWLVDLLRVLQDCAADNAQKTPPLFTPDLMSRALVLVSQQLDQPLSIASLASQLFISPSYLSRIFRKWMGISPYQYILKCRISKACMLLTGTDSITEISFRCGFQDCSNFVSAFHRSIGVTPLEYRKKQEKLLGDK